jgi:hypothetical protein
LTRLTTIVISLATERKRETNKKQQDLYGGRTSRRNPQTAKSKATTPVCCYTLTHPVRSDIVDVTTAHTNEREKTLGYMNGWWREREERFFQDQICLISFQVEGGRGVLE